MDILTDLAAHTEVLRRLVGEGCDAAGVPERMASLDDGCVVDVIREASAVITAAESLRVAAAGIAAARSSRERGHGGLSQSRGHTSAVTLVQAVGGTTRADAIRQVKVGEALLAGLGVGADRAGGTGDVDTAGTPDGGDVSGGGDMEADKVGRRAADGGRRTGCGPWHAPLDHALLRGRITAA